MEPEAKELSDIFIGMFLCYKQAISVVFTEQAWWLIGMNRKGMLTVTYLLHGVESFLRS